MSGIRLAERRTRSRAARIGGSGSLTQTDFVSAYQATASREEESYRARSASMTPRPLHSLDQSVVHAQA